MAWLCHPVTLVAVALLIVNDHLLKRVWPGAVTGKLSDVAGMLVTPPLLALLLSPIVSAAARFPVLKARLTADRVPPVPVSRSRSDDWAALAAIMLTGAAFALVKATAAGAETAERVWAVFTPSATVVADATDLAALPALTLAWLVWRRVRPAFSDRTVRQAERTVRPIRVVLALPAAVLAVTATSAAGAPSDSSVVQVEADDGQIFAFLDPQREALVTNDQGRSWRRMEDRPSAPPQTRACVPGEPRLCYRVLPPRLKVERSADGGATWSVDWQISPGRQGWLERNHEPPYLNAKALPVASMAVAVLPVPGGHVVAVADGADGVALRDPSGQWRRLSLADDRDNLSESSAPPLSSTGSQILAETGMAVLGAIVMLLVVLAITGWAIAPVVITIASLLVPWWLGSGPRTPEDSLMTIVFWGMGLFTAMGGAAGMLASKRPKTSRRHLVVLPAAFSAVYLPFLSWSAGWLDDYGTARLLAGVLYVLVFAVSAGAAIRSRARRRPARQPAG
ncbi:hypothetical protein [Planotetraspora kaengkrachanensis]|uniref:hypothetical protein n=1 Tax=Planotetraspora kaengkrachanensis TaxID=575193 RepID=UPI0019413D06|nr:hypothetical protein [Planotetraspora kaengkrachanensis]